MGRPKKINFQERWNEPGSIGFWNWVEDICPRVLSSANKYVNFAATSRQKENIDEILRVAADSTPNFKRSMSLLIQPRRHGKSTIFKLIVLWLLTSRQNYHVALLGNSEQHCRKVQFLPLKKTILHTPKLSKLCPAENLVNDTIRFAPYDSQISKIHETATFGEKIDCLWVSDLHAAVDLSKFNDLQASLLDSQNSLILIDANCDPEGGHVHALQQEAKNDATIYCDHVFYKNFTEYRQKAPEWINRAKAKRLKKTLLPAVYKRDVLGQRSDAVNSLFPSEIIERCLSDYRLPITDIKALTQGRKYRIGAGLDRAKNLLSLGGDNSVWTVICKVSSPLHGEAEYFILEQKIFPVNTSRIIKKAILDTHEKYNLDAVIFENYETSDLSHWMASVQIPCELLAPYDRNQSLSFTEFHRVANEGRLHIPRELKQLQSEMSTFGYQRKNSRLSFGHISKKFKDDCVYSLNWAIYSLRTSVLHSYEIGNITCTNRSGKRRMCFLMGGDLVLLCSEQCLAFKQVNEMFQQYKSIDLDSEIVLPEFFEYKCRFNGVRLQQAI